MTLRRKKWITLSNFEAQEGHLTVDSDHARSASEPLPEYLRSTNETSSRAVSYQLPQDLHAIVLAKVHEARDPQSEHFIDEDASVETVLLAAFAESLALPPQITGADSVQIGAKDLPSGQTRNSQREECLSPSLTSTAEELALPPFSDSGISVDGSETSIGNDMASASTRTPNARTPSRYENRPPMSSVQCRNGPGCRKLLEGLTRPKSFPCLQSLQFSGTCHYSHDYSSNNL